MKREPVCVLGERVWRTYLGGREIGKIHGDEKAEDSHFPEEWMQKGRPSPGGRKKAAI